MDVRGIRLACTDEFHSFMERALAAAGTHSDQGQLAREGFTWEMEWYVRREQPSRRENT